MDWFVFGDVAFLEVILNAIAAMFSPFSNSAAPNNAYSGLVSAAALIGVLLLLVTSVIMGNGNPLRKILASLTVYLIAFAPTTTVTTVSNQTGESRTVSNVPVSIAFTGMFFSRIGSGMTSIFEQAYSVPNMTPNGFVDALHSWRSLRALTSSQEAWTSANGAGGGDFAGSWKNYVSDCAARAIESGQLSVDTVRQASLVQQGLAVTNDVMTTLINTNGAWVLRDCETAYTSLLNYSSATVVPAVRGLLQDYFSKPGTLVPTPFSVRLTDMAQTMRLGALSENDLVLSFLLASLYEEGIAQRHILDGRATYAQVIYDAIRQRNIQWSAQGDLFSHYVQPVLTFVEGFFYATLPLVLVLLVLSANGFGLFTKFLGLGLWIQFWFPISAIVHLFTYISVESAIDDIIAAGIPPASFAGIAMAEGVVEKWLSVSGMFASAIPVLALFLITGSVYAFQGLATSVGGPDTVTEKNAQPDTYAAAPVTQGLPRYEESQLRGRAGPGAVDTLPSYTLAHDRSQSVRSAERESEGAREAFSQSMSRAFSTMSGSRSSSDAVSGVREAISTDSSTTQQFMRGEGSDFVRRFAEQHGVGEREARQYALDAAMGVQASPRVGPQGRAGVSGGGSEAQYSTNSRSNELQTAMSRQMSENEQFANGLTESLARDFTRTNSNSNFAMNQSSETQELRDSAEQYLAAERSYEEALSAQRSTGAQQRLDTPFLSQQIAGNDRQFENLSRVLAQRRLLGEASMMAERWITAGHFGSDTDGRRQALVGAGLAALDRAGMTEDLSGMLRPWGLYVPDIGAPDPIGGMAPEIPTSGGTGSAGGSVGAAAGGGSGPRAESASRPVGGVAPPAMPSGPSSPSGEVYDRFLENAATRPGPEAHSAFRAELAGDRAARVASDDPSLYDQTHVAIERMAPDGLLPGSPDNRYDRAVDLGLPEPMAEFYRQESRSPGSPDAQAARRAVLLEPSTPEERAVAEEALTNLEAAAARSPHQAELYVRRAGMLSDDN